MIKIQFPQLKCLFFGCYLVSKTLPPTFKFVASVSKANLSTPCPHYFAQAAKRTPAYASKAAIFKGVNFLNLFRQCHKHLYKYFTWRSPSTGKGTWTQLFSNMMPWPIQIQVLSSSSTESWQLNQISHMLDSARIQAPPLWTSGKLLGV